MHCPQCHHENEKEARFCEHCGAPLPLQTKKKGPLLFCGADCRRCRGFACGWLVFNPPAISQAIKPTRKHWNSPTVFDVARLRKRQSQLS